jgi:hypothetical protein
MPGLSKIVSPGLALLTAAWIDCPGRTTILADGVADADAATVALRVTPSPVAHAAVMNLRTLAP